ncbi:UDP-GlcNAc--UDP-phosphate GlcNAc-1-phosphate transferase [Pedobacter sp. JCM 36344]|uniref:UDP-GlcNAc--UDP-phosphate GlcNAc-1-phosphate transferase n=1 Tax=Pedobacter sp. JCM 36344 TaxID=3374280 RepID=UPI003978F375
MTTISLFLVLALFFAIAIIYFRVALYCNIVDKPNHRSSHHTQIIRGGGIIFIFAAFILFCLNAKYWIFVIGVIVVGIISFIDDILTLSNKIRVLFHVISVTLLFLALEMFSTTPLWIIALLYVVIIGTINAYNFMDGINGITGAYSLVVLGGLQYVNYSIINYVDPDLIWLPIIACLVFLYYNFRKNARWFAGDVGSITLSFWISFLLLKLIVQTGNMLYILFLLIYGLDTFTTILFRLIRKENIFEAHRSHFYQFLVNEKSISHLLVATGYGLTQLLVIISILNIGTISLLGICAGIVLIAILFISVRFALEGKEVLLNSKADEQI